MESRLKIVFLALMKNILVIKCNSFDKQARHNIIRQMAALKSFLARYFNENRLA